MADINAGTPVKFDVGGNIVIWDAATSLVEYNVIRMEPGTLRLSPGLYELLHIKDKGLNTALVMTLDEMVSEISFGVRPTETGLSSAADLLDVLLPTPAAGLRPLFRVDVEIPDAPHSATGQQLRFEGCWLANPWEFQGRSGANTDLLNVVLNSTDIEPTVASY